MNQTTLRSTENTLYNIGSSLINVYANTMLNMDVKWQAELPAGPKIFAINHPTTTDPIYITTVIKEPISVLITQPVFEIPVVGSILKATGQVPALRSSNGSTIDAMAQKIREGRNVAIFPEGHLSPIEGGFYKPHTGVARLALRTGAPVVPIGIGLQRNRIKIVENAIKSDETTGHFYTNGKYAITVGTPVIFGGNEENRPYVRAVTNTIMNQVKYLAFQSEDRINANTTNPVHSTPMSAGM